MKVIAHIQNDYTEKFGVPRQGGRVSSVKSRLIFLPEYRVKEAFRGLEGYSHIWLLWEFSLAQRETWSPTVRPPKLGGNERIGVFATRSPFRPNPLGLTCVTLEEIVTEGKEAPYLIVGGADLMNGTPVYDIKPYLPYADAYPDAKAGFTARLDDRLLEVEIPVKELEKLPPSSQKALFDVLAQDPRPGYQEDPDRIYGMSFAGKNVRFRVSEGKLTVLEIS
ncbi:MAG: tRNA (N6-threonylcarbamoyladenosine(37)-N6)-methyltransferase TrmO [Blautia sp.]|nr:tRNA (N6-threonylcarbamoyladenosine(37)-N6)-methyltransferase TrmO [Blautia sp.]